ncbi:MAG: galactokinase [Bdellovibrionaceae bacterium]|nr:galactokinase [Pseudobdellovibrionaceae bacterium]
MNTFVTKCPTRIDLAGGTIDLWPIWAMIEKCSTVNVAIDIFTTCEISERSDTKIIIRSPDIKKEWSFADFSELQSNTDKDFLFFKAHIQHWQPKQGFELEARSQSPVGGGLGGSSSLSVAIYKTFQKWLAVEGLDVHQMVRHCSNIEAQVLATPTGLQDYYGAASKGLHIIDFSTHGVHLETYSEHVNVFNDSVVIVYTGRSHHSGINNWGVLKKFIDKDANTTAALLKIRDVALKMRAACLKREWSMLPQLFTEDFTAREQLSQEFMSPEIAELKKISDQADAVGFKICGAGGGGCVAIWSDANKKQKIIEAIHKKSYQILDAHFL